MFEIRACVVLFLLGWVCGQILREADDNNDKNNSNLTTGEPSPGHTDASSVTSSLCVIHCSCLQRISSLSSLLRNSMDCTAGGFQHMPQNISLHTEALVLASNHLHAEDIVELDALVNLTELDLSGNRMYSLENLHIDVDGLLYLLLDHNELDYLPNRSFLSTPNLIFLSLVENKIEIMHAEAFVGLRNLQTLDLTGNRIFDLNVEWFRTLLSLRVLHLHDNNIHTIQASAFKFLRSLRTLDLSENHIKHIYPGAFSGLDKLHQLFLQDNHLNVMPERAFNNFHALSVLDLGGNYFPRLESGTLRAINVSTLSLTHLPHLLLIDKGAISNMQLLTSLDLSNNPHFMYIDGEALQQVPRLHTLKLHHNNLSTLEEVVMQNVPSLTHLSFYGNSPHCDCNLNWIIHEMIYHSRNLTILHPQAATDTGNECSSPPSLKGIDLTAQQLLTLPETCPPRILPLFTHEYNTALGETVLFDCRATGIPHPQTDWLLPAHHKAEANAGDIVVLKAGSRSADNEHVQVTTSGTLFVDYVQGVDQGQYTCLASNPQGRDERTAHVHVKNIEANVIIMRITADAITVTWKSTRYAHDYQILYRRFGINFTYHVIDIKPYMRSYTVSELEAKTQYEFCIAVQHATRSVRINCTQVTTRDGNYLELGVFDSRDYIIGGSIASFLVVCILICALTHIVRRYNKRRRQQEELYTDNLSQLFLASMDSMSDTTPITYENRAAEMFDDDDIDEIRSTASMASTSTSLR